MATAKKPTYEFLVSNGRPQPADKRMRSHAIRAALRTRMKGSTAVKEASSIISANSDLTLRSQAQLKGRFRLVPMLDAKVTSPGTVAQDAFENTLGVISARLSGNAAALEDNSEQRVTVLSANEGNWAISVLQDQEPIPDSIRRDRLDPFDSIPVQNNRSVDFLIKHFLTQFNLNLTTVDPQRSWFAYALTEPLIMHTTLALSGAGWLSREFVIDNGLKQEVERQKLESIKTIRSQIEGPNVVDTIIAGVATLANVACFEGAFGEADMHMGAVRQMIDARGGVATFRSNFLISRAVTWNDLQTASALGRAPYFPLIHGADQLRLPSGVQEMASRIQLDHLEQISMDTQIAEIFMILHKVILAREYHVGPHEVRILMNVADDQLLRDLARHSAKELQCSFSIALLSGAHLFLYAALRQVPPGGLLLQTLLARLEGHLKSLTFNPDSRGEVHAWLWLLFVGMLVESLGRPSVPTTFTIRLEVFCRAHAILDVEAVMHVLKKFLWLDSACLQPSIEFWARLAPAEGVVVSQEII